MDLAVPAPAHARSPSPTAPPARPAEVLAALDAPAIRAPEDGQRVNARLGLAATRAAIDLLGEPRILVNRDVDDALRLLRSGGRFSTAFDVPDDVTVPIEQRRETAAYLRQRRDLELALGTHGHGALAGRTVYGSVAFGRDWGPEPWGSALQDAADGARAAGPRTTNAGISLTAGAVTFVLRPDAAQRATFLPGDTYANLGGARPLPVERLDEAVWANVRRHAGDYLDEDDGLAQLVRRPRDEAARGIAAYLGSRALDRWYLEAQVRGASLDDVETIIVRGSANTRRSGRDLPPLEDALDAVRSLAAKRGIQLVEAP